MNFGDIVGQSALTDNLAAQMRSGKIVHAYIFVGERGMGKRTLAGLCAQTLVCEGELRSMPCGECGPCRRVLSGNHPDVKTIVPGWSTMTLDPSKRLGHEKSAAEETKSSKKAASKTLGVEDIRALSAFLSKRPFEGKRNIAILPEAQNMTVQAQNAFLKTLETPPGQSVIFLCCDNVRAMLPTIISRCRVVNFAPLPTETVEKYLKTHGTQADRAHLLASICGGSIGRALEMGQSEEYWTLRASVLTAIGKLKTSADVAAFTQALTDMKNSSERVLDILELYARDLMLLGKSAPLNSDMREQLERQSKTINGLTMLSGIIRARERLKSNVGWSQVLDAIGFDALGGTTWQ